MGWGWCWAVLFQPGMVIKTRLFDLAWKQKIISHERLSDPIPNRSLFSLSLFPLIISLLILQLFCSLSREVNWYSIISKQCNWMGLRRLLNIIFNYYNNPHPLIKNKKIQHFFNLYVTHSIIKWHFSKCVIKKSNETLWDDLDSPWQRITGAACTQTHKKGTKTRLPIFTVLEISNSISRDPGITSKSCSAKLTLWLSSQYSKSIMM